MKASFPTVVFDVVPRSAPSVGPQQRQHIGLHRTDNSDMIYFFRDECTNLLPCCPVRLICYDVTPSRLFSMMMNSLLLWTGK